jgi:hypothetical protein
VTEIKLCKTLSGKANVCFLELLTEEDLLYAFGKNGTKFIRDPKQLPLEILRSTSANRDTNWKGTTGAFMKTVMDGQGMIEFYHLMWRDTVWKLQNFLIGIPP